MSALPRMSVNVPLLTQPWRASVSFTAPGPGGAQLLCTARRQVGFTQAHGGWSWGVFLGSACSGVCGIGYE